MCTRSPRTPSFPSSGTWYIASSGPGASSLTPPTPAFIQPPPRGLVGGRG